MWGVLIQKNKQGTAHSFLGNAGKGTSVDLGAAGILGFVPRASSQFSSHSPSPNPAVPCNLEVRQSSSPEIHRNEEIPPFQGFSPPPARANPAPTPTLPNPGGSIQSQLLLGSHPKIPELFCESLRQGEKISWKPQRGGEKQDRAGGWEERGGGSAVKAGAGVHGVGGFVGMFCLLWIRLRIPEGKHARLKPGGGEKGLESGWKGGKGGFGSGEMSGLRMREANPGEIKNGEL